MRQRLPYCGYWRILATAAWLLFTVAGASTAQEVVPPKPSAPADSQPAATPAPKPSAETPLQGEVLPEVHYLPDKDGNLQAVLGFAWEQFVELYKLKHQLDQQNQQPSFSIQALAMTGSVAGQRIELVADFTVIVHQSGWVRVPLRLGNAMLREKAAFDGDGDHEIDLAPDGDGYLAWIRDEPGTTHKIILRLWAPLAQVGPESHLRLSAPRAVTSSLQLQIPFEKAVARVSEGSTIDSIKSVAGGKSLVNVVGAGGEFDLAWHAADTEVAQLPTVLEAACSVLARIDGRNVNCEAKLTVRSSGGEFDRFRVRLPPEAEYVPTPQVDASLVAVESPTGNAKMFEVKLAKKTAGPVEVRLVTRRAHQPQRDDETVELAGFDVVGAVRQWGTVAVRVEGNWQVQWGELRNVRQIDDLGGLLGREEATAGFEYSVQPYSLTARIKAQETRIRVEGDYVVLVGSNEAQLRAKLKYMIRGAKVRSLEIDLPGWDVDLIGPSNLVNVDAVAMGQNSPLVIPLLQAHSGELELTFEGRQEISPASGKVSLRMPAPRGQSVAPANVIILPADNVELLIEPDETSALVAQNVRAKGIQLPDRQQEPLYLRTSGESPTFVASMLVHEQTMSTAVSAQLEIDERETRVDERMTVQIAYEPTDHLTLGVPRAIRPDRLAITLDGQRLAPVPTRERTDKAASDVVPMRIALPAPRIGRVELQIRYSLPHDQLASLANTLVNVPLVMPGEGPLASNELSVVPKSGISVSYPKGPWTEAPRGDRSNNTAGLILTASSALPQVALAVSFKERHLQHATTVEQAWIQTRLTETQRQDRAVYRLTTSEPSLRLSMPAGVESASLVVEIDGRRIKPELDLRDDTRDLVVPISGTAASEHLLDLRYHFSDRPARGELALEAFQLKPARWVQQTYWQLILPAGEHVFGVPKDFTREYRWVWSDLFWVRHPSLDERELDSWIAATSSSDNGRVVGETEEQFEARQQTEAAASNYYLYSAVGAVQPLEVHTLGRARLVLLASLPILVCGLLLIYLPATRHPAALLIAAFGVAVVGVIDPESAVLLAQAASLGLALALVAFILTRIGTRPEPPPAPSHGSSKAIERPFTEIYPRAVGSGSQPSTTTNPLVPSSVPESQP